MKQIKIITLGLLLTLGALSFMSRNNFKPDGLELFNDEELVTATEFRNMVNTELVQPIIECYTEVHRNAFMTKCYSDINFLFEHESREERVSFEGEEHIYYANYPVNGDVVFYNCGHAEHICAVQAVYATKEIKVRESFLSEWIDKKEYLELFCRKIKEQKDRSTE